MKLNVQLIFIYDGPKRPNKRNKRGGNRVDRELTRLLHQLLTHLKIPYHEAPGEAEAECAALQKIGQVDAVWSDDGDAFMFGATTLIKAHKDGRNRAKDHVKVFTADAIRNKFDFDADSFMLFALLSGGDYDTTGLRGCGPQAARRAAKRGWKVASAARHVKQDQLSTWRAALKLALRESGCHVEIPDTFPSFRALEYYRDPTISTVEQLSDLRGLRRGWDAPIDQTKLRNLLRIRFNFGTRGFLKHIAPVYLSRALARATPPQQVENLRYEVLLKRTVTRKTADGEDAPAKAERKVTFLPGPAVAIDLSGQPQEEDWSIWDGKDGVPYDPLQRIECELPLCFLRHGLPADALVTAPLPVRKKRKNDENETGFPSPRKTKRRKMQAAKELPDDDREQSIKAVQEQIAEIESLFRPENGDFQQAGPADGTPADNQNRINQALQKQQTELQRLVASMSDATNASSKAKVHASSRKSDSNNAAPKRPRKKKGVADAPVEKSPSPPPATFRRPELPATLTLLDRQSTPRIRGGMSDDERLAWQLHQEELTVAPSQRRPADVLDLGEDTEDEDAEERGCMCGDERLARQLQEAEDMQGDGFLPPFGYDDLDRHHGGPTERSDTEDELPESPLFVTPARAQSGSKSATGAFDQSQSALVDQPLAAHGSSAAGMTASARRTAGPLASRSATPLKPHRMESASVIRAITDVQQPVMAPTVPNRRPSGPSIGKEDGMVPGEAIGRATLRELRATAFLRMGSSSTPGSSTSRGPSNMNQGKGSAEMSSVPSRPTGDNGPVKRALPVVIDLT